MMVAPSCSSRSCEGEPLDRLDLGAQRRQLFVALSERGVLYAKLIYAHRSVRSRTQPHVDPVRPPG